MLRQALRTASRAATQAARGFATQAGESKGGVSVSEPLVRAAPQAGPAPLWCSGQRPGVIATRASPLEPACPRRRRR